MMHVKNIVARTGQLHSGIVEWESVSVWLPKFEIFYFRSGKHELYSGLLFSKILVNGLYKWPSFMT